MTRGYSQKNKIKFILEQHCEDSQEKIKIQNIIKFQIIQFSLQTTTTTTKLHQQQLFFLMFIFLFISNVGTILQF